MKETLAVRRKLRCAVYTLGEAVHKGVAYPGEHDSIIDVKLWDRAHDLISGSRRRKSNRQLGRTPALLKGMIFAPNDVAMTPSHTRKRGKLYRYYVAIDAIKSGVRSSALRRIPAAQIEAVVIAQIRALLQSPEVIVATWRAARKTIKGLTECAVRDELHRFEQLWGELFPAEQARIVQLLVERVDISETGADISLRIEGLTTLLQDLRSPDERRDAA